MDLSSIAGSTTIIFFVIGILVLIILPYIILWAFLKSAVREGVKEAMEQTIIKKWNEQIYWQQQQQKQFMQQQQMQQQITPMQQQSINNRP